MPLIVEPEAFQQQEQSDRLIIVDLCDRDTYLRGHIPGAIHIDPKATTRGGQPPGLLPEEAELKAIVEKLGLQEDSHLLVYDNEGGGWAGRFIWLLDCINVQSYSYLNGGLTAWQAIDGPLQSGEETALQNARIEINISKAPSVSREEIEFLLGAPGSIDIWDARSPEEYRGEKIVAQRGGHIPGAINGNWLDFMDREQHLKIRSDAQTYLKNLGIDGSRPIITHCQTHHRSGLTYLIAKALDYDIRAYPGSWSEWGNASDTEIE
ncbi:sulfurtransferase [Pseudoteredinibacter isoporae]|nr:sulfurtransferase [Pseudoteredinibacter isoporae]NIB25318.1 sulfurtransferase [Pseudoteredinibacter isoporae]